MRSHPSTFARSFPLSHRASPLPLWCVATCSTGQQLLLQSRQLVSRSSVCIAPLALSPALTTGCLVLSQPSDERFSTALLLCVHCRQLSYSLSALIPRVRHLKSARRSAPQTTHTCDLITHVPRILRKRVN